MGLFGIATNSVQMLVLVGFNRGSFCCFVF